MAFMNFIGEHLLTEIPQLKKKKNTALSTSYNTHFFACVVETNDSLQMRFRIFLPQGISL